MIKNARRLLFVIVPVVTVAACDRDPLMAPVASTISLTAQTTTLRPGESTELTAIVIEEAGTTVHDGTVVRFSSTLGSVSPEQARTDEGIAKTTFTAGAAAGTARVVALSGAAEPGPDVPNTIEIVIAN